MNFTIRNISLAGSLALSLATVGCAADGDPMATTVQAVDNAAPATALRVNRMEIRDPHVYMDFFGCSDITTIANALLDQGLKEDKTNPPDGSLDINVIPIFQPYDPAAASTPFQLDLGAKCTVPVATTTCTSTGQQVTTSVANNATTGTCLPAIPGTTFAGYTPALVTPAAPCFRSSGGSLSISIGTVTIPLQDAQIAGRYDGANLADGQLRGFVSLAQARLTVFPADLPFVGGKTLASLLAGGDTSCRRPDGGSDLDVGPDGVTPGWYFYLNYAAAPASYTPAVQQ
jgi:hypothetical protein